MPIRLSASSSRNALAASDPIRLRVNMPDGPDPGDDTDPESVIVPGRGMPPYGSEGAENRPLTTPVLSP